MPANAWNRIYAPPCGVSSALGAVTILVEVRLYAIGGTIHWDMVTSHQAESTGSNAPGLPGALLYNDLVPTVAAVVNYAQGRTPEWAGALSNKPDLNIDAPTGTFGVVLSRVYSFADMGNIWQTCFQELTGSGLCDVDVVWNAAGTTRQFVIYVQKGSVKPQLGLTLGGNVVDFSYDFDGQNTASSVVVVPKYETTEPTLGDVIPWCEYKGYAVDVTANSGITLGSVDTTAIETLPDGVELRAQAELARLKTLVTIPTLMVKEPADGAGTIIGVLQTGDTIPVQVNYGFVNDNTTYRVTSMTLTPASETLAVTVGVVPLGTGVVAIGNGQPATGNNNRTPSQLAAFEAINANLLNLNRAAPLPQPPNFAQVGQTNLNYITNAQALVYDQPSGNLIGRNPYDIIYNMPGSVALATSPAVAPRDPILVTGLSAQLSTPGSTSTVVNLLKNGAIVASVNLGSGVGYANVAISPPISYGARGDTFAVSVTAIGAGASNLAGGIELGG